MNDVDQQTDSLSLRTLGDEQLAAAHRTHTGRATRTMHGGHDRRLRQTMLALVAGHGLREHESPGEATLLVLRGRVKLATAMQTVDVAAGHYLVVPRERHSPTALDDSVLLLTVVAALDQ